MAPRLPKDESSVGTGYLELVNHIWTGISTKINHVNVERYGPSTARRLEHKSGIQKSAKIDVIVNARIIEFIRRRVRGNRGRRIDGTRILAGLQPISAAVQDFDDGI